MKILFPSKKQHLDSPRRFNSILTSSLPSCSILTLIHSDMTSRKQFLNPCQELGGLRFILLVWPWIAGLSIFISSTQSRGFHHLYPGGSGAAMGVWPVSIVINRDCCILMSSRVRHFCSFTSSYAIISILHDDPREGSMFKNYYDLDNFDGGFYHTLDTSVRDVHSGEQTE